MAIADRPAGRAAPLLRRSAVWIAVALVFLVAPHLFTSNPSRTMLSLMGIMIVFALSYNILMGQTGLPSFGHAIYYGLGGYAAAHVMNAAAGGGWLPLVLVPIAGGIGGLLCGLAVGSFSTRRAGTTFAMISLGVAELVGSAAPILRGFFGGEEGITTDRTALPGLFGLTFGPQLQVYYLIACWCLLCMGVIYALTGTPLGRMFNAVRDNAERAEFIGYSVRRVRYYAVCFAGFFAGIAGALSAINFEIVGSGMLGVEQSGLVLFMAFIGGIWHFGGPVIGAIFITLLQTALSDVTAAWRLYFGLIFVLIVMYAPGGIAGSAAALVPLWQRGTLHRILPSLALASVPAAIVTVGFIMAAEMGYQLGANHAEGPQMKLFWQTIDASAPLLWVLAIALFAGGAIGLHLALRRLREAWVGARGLETSRS